MGTYGATMFGGSCWSVNTSGDDGNAIKEIKEDGIQVPVGPVTRARSRRFKEELNTLIIKLQCDTKDICIKEEIQEHKKPMIVHVIQALVDESI